MPSKFALLDPQLLGDLRIVSAYLFDEPRSACSRRMKTSSSSASSCRRGGSGRWEPVAKGVQVAAGPFSPADIAGERRTHSALWTHEERKLPYMAHLLAAVCFDPNVTHAYANQLIAASRPRPILARPCHAARPQLARSE